MSMETAEQIACLQAQNAALKIRIEHKDLADRLAAKVDTRALGLPSVQATYGVGGALKALLTWSGHGGGTLVAGVGETVPGGWVIDSIESGKVVIRNGSTRSTLLLANGVSGDSAPVGAQAFGGAVQPVPTGAPGSNPYSAPPLPGFGQSRPAPGA